MTLNDALKNAALRLAHAGVEEPQREASSLLALGLQRPRSFLIAHPEYELSRSEQTRFEDSVARRESREPFQYITGHQEFWGLEFAVTRGVLIPRPETELLVEAAIEHLRELKDPTFVEAGVGSGCISVSILHSLARSKAIATDISPVAIETAQMNAAAHGVLDRLDLRKTDLLAGLSGMVDLVVSNPPYIPDGDIARLQPEVRDYEPHGALAGGPDGLDVVRRLARDSGHILEPGGVLMMEIGAGQAAAVAGLFDGDEWGTPNFLNDRQAIPRVVIAKRQRPE
jgi:release factor glutamine methyltransferase